MSSASPSAPVSERASQLQSICGTGLTVILPVWNEQAALPEVLDTLDVALHSLGVRYELLVVDDGSTDGSREWLRTRAGIRLLEHPQNRGYGASLKTGIRQARFETIVIADADGSYPVDQLPVLLQRLEHADMVVGARTGAEVEYSWLRSIPKWFLVRFAEWMARRRIPDLNSGLRVFRKREAERFLKIFPNGFSFTTTITLALLTNGYLVEYVPINYRRRTGRSKFRPISDTLLLLRTIVFTGMYFAPLRVFLPIASLFLLGFLYTLGEDIFVRRDLTERTLILLVAGTQLGMFGLLAEMIDKRSA